MARFKHRNQRGDTLIEVVMALAILSMTLLGSSSVAMKSFQISQTARERTTVAFAAQAQLEAVRSFRDNHSWAEFLNGNSSPLYQGVLSAPTSGCHKLPTCFYMQAVGGVYTPVPGSTNTNGVPTSYIEIMPVPSGGSPPTTVKFQVAWGFDGVGGGVQNSDNLVTELTDIKTAATGIAVGPLPVIPPGPTLCTISPTNLVPNGDFHISPTGTPPNVSAAAKFTSELPNRGDDVYPDDAGTRAPLTGVAGGFSIRRTDFIDHDLFGNLVIGTQFPGDPIRTVPRSDNYFYSNPNQYLNGTPGPFIGNLWQETITNLQPNTQYHFYVYFSNLNPVGADPSSVNPKITLMINGAASAAATNMDIPKGGTWVPVETQFTTPATTPVAPVTLAIRDSAGSITGDDFGMAQVTLFACN